MGGKRSEGQGVIKVGREGTGKVSRSRDRWSVGTMDVGREGWEQERKGESRREADGREGVLRNRLALGPGSERSSLRA